MVVPTIILSTSMYSRVGIYCIVPSKVPMKCIRMIATLYVSSADLLLISLRKNLACMVSGYMEP